MNGSDLFLDLGRDPLLLELVLLNTTGVCESGCGYDVDLSRVIGK